MKDDPAWIPNRKHPATPQSSGRNRTTSYIITVGFGLIFHSKLIRKMQWFIVHGSINPSRRESAAVPADSSGRLIGNCSSPEWPIKGVCLCGARISIWFAYWRRGAQRVSGFTWKGADFPRRFLSFSTTSPPNSTNLKNELCWASRDESNPHQILARSIQTRRQSAFKHPSRRPAIANATTAGK